MIDLMNDINWERVAEQYHAVYDGKSAAERVILRQMTDAWAETRLLQNLRQELLRKIGTVESVTMRSVALECAAYAEHILAHWKILAELLATTMEGVAAAMEREATRLRKIGWIAPVRACEQDYRILVDLVKAR